MKLKLLAASIVTAGLIGCGGDSDDNNPAPTSSSSSSSVASSSSSSVVSSSSSSVAANTPATFTGLEGTVANDTATLTGNVTVTDPDDGEDTVEALTDATATYGTFSIATDGSWTYNLDTSGADVSALDGADDTLTDTIAIESADGTAATVTITITGVDAATGGNKYAFIDDSTTDDTGEIRVALGEGGQLAGRVTASISRSAITAMKDGAEKNPDAYITLYNSTGSTSSNRSILDLKVRESGFEIRDAGEDLAIDTAMVLDEWYDMDITWSAPDKNTLAEVTIKINGQEVAGGTFTTTGTASADEDGSVTHVAFRIGDNATTITEGGLSVDDIVVYDAVDGGNEVFNEDFEDFAVGKDLTDEDSGFHNRTQDAVVEGSGGGSGGTNKAAFVDDSTTDDTGEVRVALGESGQIVGRVTASILRTPITATKEGADKNPDAYITLYNSTGSTSSNRSILDLKVRDSGFEIRDAGEDLAIDTAMVLDQWYDMEITWSAPDTTTLSEVTIKIDGVEVAGGTFTTTGTASADEDGSVTHVAFRIGDNATTITEGGFYVDDIVIHDAVSGGNEVFNEDFEGFAVGKDLTDEDSGFHNRTQDAAVAELAKD